MNALHYAVFFDAPEVVDALAEQTPSLVMGACSEFNNGNSLHIAAANLSLESAKILVSFLLQTIIFVYKLKRNITASVFILCR